MRSTMHPDHESSVDFPLSEPPSPTKNVSQIQAPPTLYLPFRRISLPTRRSIVSISSFDSLAEEGSPCQHLRRGNRISERKWSKAVRANWQPSVLGGTTKGKKRQKVIDEFLDTEQAYVGGLELIYDHFLTPIVASLDSSSSGTLEPLLDRTSLTAIFSNFIDIWNFHRAFLTAISSSYPAFSPVPLSSILAEHFPYLSLYTPFTTSFPSSLSTLDDLTSSASPCYNPAFSTFLTKQESDPCCGRLKLRDWLLTIIQRCPRYLLLLHDLISCTDPVHLEYDELVRVHALVLKITGTLNTSLHAYSQTLELLSLQRSTFNLPSSLQFVLPGRSLLKRDSLLVFDPSSVAGSTGIARGSHRCDVLLFSDYFVWLRDAEFSGMVKSGWDLAASLATGLGEWTRDPSSLMTPERRRTRSDIVATSSKKRSQHSTHASPAAGGGSTERRWIYHGHISLVDVEVIGKVDVTSESQRDISEEVGWKFEVLSPKGSFAIFTDTSEECRLWISAIRCAKAELLKHLGKTRPHSTLASSASQVHVRQSVRAVAFLPYDDAGGGDEKGSNHSACEGIKDIFIEDNLTVKGNHRGAEVREVDKVRHKIRREVEHFVPAVWIPDGRASACMRCGRAFGWRRRRHHCRLCGGVVCAACSGKTFYIVSDAEPSCNENNREFATRPSKSTAVTGSEKERFKPSRACEKCYQDIFPLVAAGEQNIGLPPTSSSTFPPSPGKSPFFQHNRTFTSDSNGPITGADGVDDVEAREEASKHRDKDTITSLRDLPTWVSVPSPACLSARSSGADVAVSLMNVERRERRKSTSGSSFILSAWGPRSFVVDSREGPEVGTGVPPFAENIEKGGSTLHSSSRVRGMLRKNENPVQRVKRFSLPADAALQRMSVSVFRAGIGAEEQEFINVLGEGNIGAKESLVQLVGDSITSPSENECQRQKNDDDDVRGRRTRETSLVSVTAGAKRWSIALPGIREGIRGMMDSRGNSGGTEEQRSRLVAEGAV